MLVRADHTLSYISLSYPFPFLGVGVDHQMLKKSAEQLFVMERPIWEMQSNRLPKKVPEVDNSYAQYTGGEKRVRSRCFLLYSRSYHCRWSAISHTLAPERRIHTWHISCWDCRVSVIKSKVMIN